MSQVQGNVPLPAAMSLDHELRKRIIEETEEGHGHGQSAAHSNVEGTVMEEAISIKQREENNHVNGQRADTVNAEETGSCPPSPSSPKADTSFEFARGLKPNAADEKQRLAESYNDLDALSEIVPRLNKQRTIAEIEEEFYEEMNQSEPGSPARHKRDSNCDNSDNAWRVQPGDLPEGEQPPLPVMPKVQSQQESGEDSSSTSEEDEVNQHANQETKPALPMPVSSSSSASLSTASLHAKGNVRRASQEVLEATPISYSSSTSSKKKRGRKNTQPNATGGASVLTTAADSTKSDIQQQNNPQQVLEKQPSLVQIHTYDEQLDVTCKDPDPAPPRAPPTEDPPTMTPTYLNTFKPATGCTNASDFVVRCFVARLRSGITVVKHGRSRWCKSRLRQLHIHPDGRSLSWKPALGEPTTNRRPPKLDLTTCVEVRHAWSPDPDSPLFTGTAILRQKCEAANAHKSFALIFAKRTVDLTAVTADQCKVLMEGFSALCFRLHMAHLANNADSSQNHVWTSPVDDHSRHMAAGSDSSRNT